MTVSANESLGRLGVRVSENRFRFRPAVLLLLAIATGCREAPTTVSGSVTLDGKRLAMREGMRGTVVFQPAQGGPVLNGIIGAEGTYRMAAGSSNSVQPGNYVVTVSAVEFIPPTETNPQPSSKRITPAKFASAAESGLRVTVAPGANDINLALVSDTDSDGMPEESAETTGEETDDQKAQHSAPVEGTTQ